MASKNRDEFTPTTKRKIAERAAYVCSNPDCRDPTVIPHSDGKNSVQLGVAAHIRGAAPGGPRYDVTQTPEQRRSIQNAIHLCSECNIRDKDETYYTVETLEGWKRTHEEWIRNGGIVPAPPSLSLKTLTGLTLPDFPSQVTGAQCAEMREQVLIVKNGDKAIIQSIDALIQTPEPIIKARKDPPAGVNVSFQPVRPQMVATITGGGSVTTNRPPLPTIVSRLQIDRLTPNQQVEIGFITSMEAYRQHDLSFDDGAMASEDDSVLDFYIDGTYQFEYRGAMLTRRFVLPIRFDKDRRFMSLGDPIDSSSGISLRKISFFG